MAPSSTNCRSMSQLRGPWPWPISSSMFPWPVEFPLCCAGDLDLFVGLRHQARTPSFGNHESLVCPNLCDPSGVIGRQERKNKYHFDPSGPPGLVVVIEYWLWMLYQKASKILKENLEQPMSAINLISKAMRIWDSYGPPRCQHAAVRDEQ